MVAVSQKFYEFRRGRQLDDPSGAAAGYCRTELVPIRWLPHPPGNVHRENRKLLSSWLPPRVQTISLYPLLRGMRYICGGIRSEKMPPAHRRSEPVRWGTECSGWGHQRLYLPFLPFFLPLLAVFTSSAPVASMARIITTISTPKMLLPSVA